MPIRDEPLTVVLLSDGSEIQQAFLDVTYLNPHSGKHVKAKALIDTGADVCLLPSDFAMILGHDLTAGHEISLGGIDGAAKAYKHTVKIEIPGFSTEEILVCFKDKVHMPILGVQTFLRHFVLTIDYPNGVFSLTRDGSPEGMNNWSLP